MAAGEGEEGQAGGAPPLKGRRRMYGGPEAGFIEGAVYDRYALPEGEEFRGPAVIEEREATILAPPGVVFRKESSGDVLLRWGGEEEEEE